MKSTFKLVKFRSTSVSITNNNPQLYKLPHQMVVYPDNEVTIDGYTAIWTEDDFKKWNILRDRPIFHGKSADKAEHRVIGDIHLMIFPTVFIDKQFKRNIDPYKFKRRRYGQSDNSGHRDDSKQSREGS